MTPQVAAEICHHEAVIRQAYKDSVGVWTWSVGLTKATGHNVRRYIDNPQPMEHCLSVFLWALDNYAEAVDTEFAGFDLKPHEYAGALSFHWNTGAIKSASWPDLWKAGRVDEARRSFMKWRKPPEILGRRKAEADLFFDGVWANKGFITEYTRVSKRHTPVWSSAERVQILPILEQMMGAKVQRSDAPEEMLTETTVQRMAAINAAVTALAPFYTGEK